MIRRYLPNETTYTHNKYVLSPIKVEAAEVANGMFELEIEVAKDVILNKGDILSAPTPRGEQPFRIYRIVKTLKGKKAYARHRSYDLANNFLVDIRPTNVNADNAIKNVLSGAEVAHNFTGSSDIATLGTAYYIRKNPIEAIIGAENSILNTWGGYLVRDKNNIQIKASGNDRGFEIRLGKNLIGIEDDSDESGITTRLYPTVEIDQVIKALPEKYVDSPQIGNYPDPIIKEVRISLTDAEKELPLTDIYVLMRAYCNNLYAVDNIDKPVANYKIDFVQLAKVARIEQEVKYTYEGLEQLTYETIETLTYEQLEGVSTVEQFIDLLEQIDLYDLVNIRALDLNLKAMVISYRYDCLREKYINIELGGFKPSAKYQTANVIKQIQSDIENQASVLQTAINYATEVISGNSGGYVVTRKYPDGKPYEILIMDTDNINTATNVIRMNQQGIGFSQSGYNGPFGTAITIDGQINADYIVANTLSAISANLGTVTAGVIQSADGTNYWNLNTGDMALSGNITAKRIQSPTNQNYYGEIGLTGGYIGLGLFDTLYSPEAFCEILRLDTGFIMRDTKNNPRVIMTNTSTQIKDDANVARAYFTPNNTELRDASGNRAFYQTPTYLSIMRNNLGVLDSSETLTALRLNGESAIRVFGDKIIIDKPLEVKQSIEAGTTSLNTTTNVSVTFEWAKQSIPSVSLTPTHSITGAVITAKLVSVSTTGFTAIIQGNPTSSNVTFHWIAIAD